MARKKTKSRSTLGHRDDDTLVRDIYGPYRTHPTGEVGIEVEVEGANFHNLEYYWRQEADHSLRGESAEYVLKAPVKREAVPKALNYLSKKLKQYSRVNESNRTGVHVHVNMLRSTNTQVFNMIVLYLIFEDLLVEWCGSERVGNHFCLRAKDAKNLLKTLTQCADSGNLRSGMSDRVRYAALNINSMARYGSLEFRPMRGTVDPEIIATWVRMLLKIKDYSAKFDDPFKIMEDYSHQGLRAFTRKVFGKDSKEITEFKDVWDRIEDGMYMAQPIAAAFQNGKRHYLNNKDQKSVKKSVSFDNPRATSTGTPPPPTLGDTSSSSRTVSAEQVRASIARYRELLNPVGTAEDTVEDVPDDVAPAPPISAGDPLSYSNLPSTSEVEEHGWTINGGRPYITLLLRYLRSKRTEEGVDRRYIGGSPSGGVRSTISSRVPYYTMCAPSGVSRDSLRVLGGLDVPDNVWYNIVREELIVVFPPERVTLGHEYSHYQPNEGYERSICTQQNFLIPQ